MADERVTDDAEESLLGHPDGVRRGPEGGLEKNFPVCKVGVES